MKPKPFIALKNLTVPLAFSPVSWRCGPPPPPAPPPPPLRSPALAPPPTRRPHAAPAAIAAATAAAVGRSLLEAKIAVWLLAAEEIVALVTTASAAVSLAPFVETHEPSETCSPPTPQTNALGPNGATGHGA